MKFIKDIFTESLDEGKFSSKKTVGIIASALAFLAFLMDGFHFYEINQSMFDSILLFAATMLGVSIVKNFKKTPGDKK